MRLSRGTHLALCGCNEHEQAMGPGVGGDQEISVCVFLLTASGPLWNQTCCGGRDPRPKLRAALQVAGTGVNWEPASANSAREALALTHRRTLVIGSLSYIRLKFVSKDRFTIFFNFLSIF